MIENVHARVHSVLPTVLIATVRAVQATDPICSQPMLRDRQQRTVKCLLVLLCAGRKKRNPISQ